MEVIFFFLFFLMKTPFFFFFLHQALVAACGIFVEAHMQDLSFPRAAFSLWRAGSRARGLGSLRHAGSLVEAREFSSYSVRA